MATRIRLQRHGRKHYAFYSIVAADARAPRDGRFIEKLGTYNPNTNPATIELNFDRALYWLEVGAQPTDTVRSILSREGVLMMKHLRGGVRKGAFDESAVQAKFDAWKAEHDKKMTAIRNQETGKKADAERARLDAEREVNKKIAERVADKKAALAAERAEAEVAAVSEEAAAAPAEEVAEPVAEIAEAAEETETPAEETEEAPAEEEAAPAEEA